MSFEPLESWIGDLKLPVVIAGPCSAESREQVVQTAEAVASLEHVRVFRAGIWKPRTRPGGFEGLGEIALPWLSEAKARTGLLTATEVGRPEHVEAALRHGVDVLWVGARTTPNPFMVQELADALRGCDVPVMVKNPIGPDLKQWLGAIERLAGAGLRRIVAVHRGFAVAGQEQYRFPPLWKIAVELMRRLPDVPMVCDPSHMCGHWSRIGHTAQHAMDLGMPGLMIETHADPAQAWTDREQQLSPASLAHILGGLRRPLPGLGDSDTATEIEALRARIDRVDTEILDALEARMEVVRRIAAHKKRGAVPALQIDRFNRLVADRVAKGEARSLDPSYVEEIFRIVHEASLNEQLEMMAPEDKEE